MEHSFLSHCAFFLLFFLFFFDLSFAAASPNISILFDNWCVEHGRNYSSEEEKSYRLKVFEDNYAFVTQHNEMRNSTYTLALNEFADLTHHEFKASRLSLSATSAAATAAAIDRLNKTKLQEPVLVRDIPDVIDWSTKGAVTEVKNQWHCDAPWAFAVTGAMEGINQIVTGDLIGLSEQELIDCDFNNDGCKSGVIDNAYKYVMENNGLHSDIDYPYYGRDRFCYSKELKPPTIFIDGYANIPPNNEEFILQAVARQPVSVGLCGSSRAFQFYHWGVFTGPCSSCLDHAALIVGYASVKGTDYWIIKNSWGRFWGMAGYILMQRNTSNPEGLCGINMMASYPIKNARKPPPPPPPPPQRVSSRCYFFGYCSDEETCCCVESALGICVSWICCETNSAVCCEDNLHCCPHDYPICDKDTNKCLKSAGNATRMEAVDPIHSSRKSSSLLSLVENWVLQNQF